MAILRLSKATFTGGEVSPALGARVDLARYQTALKTASNVIVHAHGGVSNRPGLEYVGDVAFGGLTVQIPFVADVDDDEAYTVMLSNERLEFTRVGAPIYETAKTFILGELPGDPSPEPDPDPEPDPPTLSATATPFTIFSFVDPGEAAVLGVLGVTVEGGAAPYTYAWSRSSGDTEVLIANETTATPTISIATGSETYLNAQFRCAVTDDDGAVYTTNVVTVYVERTGSGEEGLA